MISLEGVTDFMKDGDAALQWDGDTPRFLSPPLCLPRWPGLALTLLFPLLLCTTATPGVEMAETLLSSGSRSSSSLRGASPVAAAMAAAVSSGFSFGIPPRRSARSLSLAFSTSFASAALSLASDGTASVSGGASSAPTTADDGTSSACSLCSGVTKISDSCASPLAAGFEIDAALSGAEGSCCVSGTTRVSAGVSATPPSWGGASDSDTSAEPSGSTAAAESSDRSPSPASARVDDGSSNCEARSCAGVCGTPDCPADLGAAVSKVTAVGVRGAMPGPGGGVPAVGVPIAGVPCFGVPRGVRAGGVPVGGAAVTSAASAPGVSVGATPWKALCMSICIARGSVLKMAIVSSFRACSLMLPPLLPFSARGSSAEVVHDSSQSSRAFARSLLTRHPAFFSSPPPSEKLRKQGCGPSRSSRYIDRPQCKPHRRKMPVANPDDPDISMTAAAWGAELSVAVPPSEGATARIDAVLFSSASCSGAAGASVSCATAAAFGAALSSASF
mmetsp:Transcript_31423/g.83661  ORF Transcript_31423/g.83661 Transcript_31423/m.83661 type:complete len:503 (+) Transcript_31423:821-2329(+)